MTLADDYYKTDALRVEDTKAFGMEVIRIALGKTPNGEMSFKDFATRYPAARGAMNTSATVQDTDTVVFIQGTMDRHIINVPPLHKLLPMLQALGYDPATLVGGVEHLGYDPANPPTAPEAVPVYHPLPFGYTYPWPRYYFNAFGSEPLSDQDTFLNRVGDYSVAGCR